MTHKHTQYKIIILIINITYMIIDLILDRKEGKQYNPKEFYRDVSNYGDIGYGIADALDGGEEEDVKKELCLYVNQQGYSNDVCKYINSVKWTV